MRERLATWLVARAYRTPLVRDVPASRIYYVLRYATPRRLWNLLLAGLEFRLRRPRVSSRPYIVRLEPIGTCNLRCPLCPTGTGEAQRDRGTMDAATLERILDVCGRDALQAVLWMWGEPMLNKRLDELVAACRRRGIGTEVSTHLSLPLSQERIDRLIRSGLDWLIVSNDAATAASYAKYRIGGDFDRVVRNMKAFVERKRALGSRTPFVEWQFVPLRHNEHEMDEVVRMARAIGVDGVRFKPARLDKTRDLTFRGSVPAAMAAEWAPAGAGLLHALAGDRRSYLDFHCPFLWASISVYPGGAVAPCCETSSARDDLGNLFAQDFEALWNGAGYQRARRVALGLALTEEDRAIACHGCKVFAKPLAAPAEASRTAGYKAPA